jgi:hypothetical protein
MRCGVKVVVRVQSSGIHVSLSSELPRAAIAFFLLDEIPYGGPELCISAGDVGFR